MAWFRTDLAPELPPADPAIGEGLGSRWSCATVTVSGRHAPSMASRVFRCGGGDMLFVGRERELAVLDAPFRRRSAPRHGPSVRQQRLRPIPQRVGQVMSIEHEGELPQQPARSTGQALVERPISGQGYV